MPAREVNQRQYILLYIYASSGLVVYLDKKSLRRHTKLPTQPAASKQGAGISTNQKIQKST